ncbi:sideroflexin-2 isoform X2 [Sus scrofa]|nr:sideroflexin-2 isoform X2 [Sus scrofa]XP_020929126.1 sideroflexin-2 isoform X2 [Sus scrofa]XP_020929127.1 sideroflexin-2 isoform X2 [Sus scrofa]
MEADLSGFNIDAPRWDQSTFLGRVKHFFNITDPRTILVPERELDWAKAMVEKGRVGAVPPGTPVEQLLYAKKLYDSAFHPDTGEKMNVIGRMSFQVPGGMIITGFMLQFYRTMPAVIFWQWVNQSFNALVNYTNRNAASPTSLRQMAVSYITATTTAVATAVSMNMMTKRAPPLVGRWVPFAAVAAANCVNIPMMRQHISGPEALKIQPSGKGPESCGHRHHPGGNFSDRHGSPRHDPAAGGHGKAGETALHEENPGPARPVAGSAVRVLVSNGSSWFGVSGGVPGSVFLCPGWKPASSSWCRWRVGSSRRNANCQFPIWNRSSETASRPSVKNLCLMSTSIRVSKCSIPARTSPHPYPPAPP